VSATAIVEIWNLRLSLPDQIDPDDEDAVRAYVRSNLNRVREAAQECDPADVVVSGVAEVDAPESPFDITGAP